eukprot:scaffold33538_cov179-Skeletonema_dohrnii-CCMP3373.AAC.6
MEEMRRKHKTVEPIRNLIGLVTRSLIAISSAGILYLRDAKQFIVWACIQAKVENDMITPEKQCRCGMIWRGYVMSCVLAIVVDGMSVAGRIQLQTFLSSEKTNLLLV